jgi:hypothetical protein
VPGNGASAPVGTGSLGGGVSANANGVDKANIRARERSMSDASVDDSLEV